MFEKLRRPGRSPKDGQIKKIFSYIFLGLICVIFVFLAPMGTQLMGQGIVGYVGKEPIWARDYLFLQENIRQRYQDRLAQADEDSYLRIQENIKQEALQSLVKIYLIAQSSLNAGFFLSDKELHSEISSFPVFQQDGRFSYSLYRSYLKVQKLNASRFEDRIRKAKLAQNWEEIFRKTIISNSLEEEKKSQRFRYKVSFHYVSFNAGNLKEQKLETFVHSKNLGKINSFLKKNNKKWEKTKEFSLFSPFGVPIAQNIDLMEVLIRYLPSTGLIPQLIRQRDKIYIVNILSFKEKSASPQEKQIEGLQRRFHFKSASVFNSWLDFQRSKIKVSLSDEI